MAEAVELNQLRKVQAATQAEQETQRQLAMAQASYRMEQEEAEEVQKNQKPGLEKMGWGKFLGALILVVGQMLLAWAADGTAFTGFGIVISVLIWIVDAGISLGLWFMLKPYRTAMKGAKWFLGLSLIVDALPIINSIPLDLAALIFVFIRSRSQIIEKVIEKAEEVAPLAQKFID